MAAFILITNRFTSLVDCPLTTGYNPKGTCYFLYLETEPHSQPARSVMNIQERCTLLIFYLYLKKCNTSIVKTEQWSVNIFLFPAHTLHYVSLSRGQIPGWARIFCAEEHSDEINLFIEANDRVIIWFICFVCSLPLWVFLLFIWCDFSIKDKSRKSSCFCIINPILKNFLWNFTFKLNQFLILYIG